MPMLIKNLLEVKNLLIVAIAYTLFITIAFLSPASGLSKINFPIVKLIHLDKLAHLLIYLLLTLIWTIYLFKINNNQLKIKRIVFLLLLFLFYGIVIEVLQENLTTSRHADIFDVLANLTGSILGALLFLSVKNRIKT